MVSIQKDCPGDTWHPGERHRQQLNSTSGVKEARESPEHIYFLGKVGGMHMFLRDLGRETKSNPKRSVTFSLRVGGGGNGLWQIRMWRRCFVILAGLGFTGAI